MARRLNARVDDELARKVEQLCERTGKNASAIIKAALEAYFEQIGGGVQGPKAALERTGFIACANGDRDLSRDYKRTLGESLRGKT